MANTASILVPIDLTSGASAINYTPGSSQCPILSLHCIVAPTGGTGTVKLTPLNSTLIELSDTSGIGGRLRVTTDAEGKFTTVEIASGGTGYQGGTSGTSIPTILHDPYGTGGNITFDVTSGVITNATIVSPGINYSGYVTLNGTYFVEGVNYDIIPRYVEYNGAGLSLIGYKLGYRPFQSF